MENDSPLPQDVPGILVSTKLLRYSQQIYHIGSLAQALPYTWTKGESHPESSGSILNWKFNVLYRTVFVSFVLLRAVQASFGEYAVIWKLFMAFLSANILLGYVGDLPVIIHREEHLSLGCRALEFVHEFQRKFTAEPPVANSGIKIFEKMVQVVGFGLFEIFCSLSLTAFLFPSLPTFFTSLLWDLGFGETLESSFGLLFLVRVIGGICMAYAQYIMWSTAMANLVVLAVLAPSVAIVMKEMGSSRLTNASFDNITTKFDVYIQLSMLVNEMSKVFAVLIAGVQFFTMAVVIFCAYCALRIGGIVGFLTGMTGVCILFIDVAWFSVLANFGGKSQSVVEGWKRNVELVGSQHAALKKRLALLRPLWIRVGSYYYIDKMLVVTICQITFENTVNALLVDF